MIYILPLKFFENAVPSDVLDQLAEFASVFFSTPVKILRTESFSKRVQHRTNEFSGLVQVHAGQILDEMIKRVPPDSFCTAAITMCDLYPRESWNFVFGLANMEKHVGVYSLARYMPGFDEGIVSSTADMSSRQKSVLLKRSCLLMCHEMCHMFGMHHCIYFHCLMNGANHYAECENTPLRLCPVCLRKLHSSCRFDIVDRYSELGHFCKHSGMKTEAEWFQMRSARINSKMQHKAFIV
jgi:archaemetzincin